MVAKNYTINFVDPTKGTINVIPAAITGPTGFNRQTDIDLIGMGHSLWGEVMLENLIHILENFSSEEDIHTITAVTSNTFTISGDVTLAFPAGRIFNIFGSDNNDSSHIVLSSSYTGTPTFETTVIIGGSPGLVAGGNLGYAGELDVPNKANIFGATTPIQGQIWFNQTHGHLRVYNIVGSPEVGVWQRVGGITISDVQPTAPTEGDLWWETAVYATSSDEYGRNLRIYVGGTWVRVVDNYLPRDGSKVMQGTLDMGTNRITGVADATGATDAVSQSYGDTRYVNVTGDTMSGSLTLNNVGTGVLYFGSDNDDYITLDSVDDTFRFFVDAIQRVSISSTGVSFANNFSLSGSMSSSLDLGNNNITNVLDPSTDSHVGDRGYNDLRYVQLTGATMSGKLTISQTAQTAGLNLHRADSNELYLHVTNSSTGTAASDGFRIGIDSSENVQIINKENTSMFFSTNDITRMSISNSGIVNFNQTPTAFGNTVWHAGNDGAGSGLDADTLDSLQATSFLQYINKNFTASSGTSGYLTFNASGTNFILQWGPAVSSSDSFQWFVFPLAFPTACFSVAAINPITRTSISLTNTQFGFDRLDEVTGSVTFYWIAIGI